MESKTNSGATPRSPMTGDMALPDVAATVVVLSDSERVKRKRQPRNSACQGCAALKMKCISTADGKCERCNRMDRQCIPAVAKPRKRRTRSNVGESEGIPIIAATPSRAAAVKFDPPRAQRTEDESGRETLLSRHDLSHTDSKSFVMLFSQGLGNIAACEELLRGIDYNFVVEAFTVYRQLTPHFPFVELRAGADVIKMVASRPVLTLAVCTVATASQPEVQARLTQAFRYAISSRVVLGNEQNLDVLTGYLVFLAWHHHYMTDHHIYQQLALLAGMAADLGLYRAWSKRTDPSSSLERDRAFVGCYYLCSGLSATAFDMPNPLRWTSELRRCADSAAASGGMPSDRSLPSILELTRAIDDMEHGLRQAADDRPSTPSHLIEVHTRAAGQRLKALKREYPSLGGTLGYAAATIHTYQRLLRDAATPESSAVIQCACAIKEYVDDMLARPASTLHQLAIVDWTNLIEVLGLMGRVFTPPTSTSGWEMGALASMLQPKHALAAMYSHMAAAPATDPLFPRNEALLSWLGSINEGIQGRTGHEGGTPVAGSGDRESEQTGHGAVAGTQAADAPRYFGEDLLDTHFRRACVW